MSQPDNDLLLEDDDAIRSLLERARRIAVLGMKTERQGHRTAFLGPRYLLRAGYEIVPVPVYYPEVEEILGIPVYRRVDEIPGPVDVVLMFRRSEHVPPHVPEIVAKGPGAVWFQTGTHNAVAARRIIAAGIAVVRNRCIMTEHRWLVRRD